MDENLYASPRFVDSEPRVVLATDGLGLSITNVRRTRTTRTLMLSGKVNAEIRYEAAGYGERIFVNGELVGRTSFWNVTFPNAVTPHVEFFIPWSDGVIPATIDVYVSVLQLLRITRFALTVDSRVIYSEGAH